MSAIADATMAEADFFAPDVLLDATVPNWRFVVRGDDAVRRQLAGWYAEPGAFEDLRRTPLPGGELLEFTLSWEERGQPHASHQIHVLELDGDGRIASDRVWCGGRWPASLLADMEEAARAC